MTVAELITQLQTLPQDSVVAVREQINCDSCGDRDLEVAAAIVALSDMVYDRQERRYKQLTVVELVS